VIDASSINLIRLLGDEDSQELASAIETFRAFVSILAPLLPRDGIAPNSDEMAAFLASNEAIATEIQQVVYAAQVWSITKLAPFGGGKIGDAIIRQLKGFSPLGAEWDEILEFRSEGLRWKYQENIITELRMN
jgi:hypothetical protein